MLCQCPVCKSKLRVERVDDGTLIYDIDKDGSTTEVVNDSNGYTRVYCTSNDQHEIPLDLQVKVLNLTE